MFTVQVLLCFQCVIVQPHPAATQVYIAWENWLLQSRLLLSEHAPY